MQRDRRIVLAALGSLVALAWLYLIAADPRPMDGMSGNSAAMAMRDGMVAHGFRPWSARDWLLMFAMWLVMMIGMMTPSVAPMVLIYARVARHAEQRLTIKFSAPDQNLQQHHDCHLRQSHHGHARCIAGRKCLRQKQLTSSG